MKKFSHTLICLSSSKNYCFPSGAGLHKRNSEGGDGISERVCYWARAAGKLGENMFYGKIVATCVSRWTWSKGRCRSRRRRRRLSRRRRLNTQPSSTRTKLGWVNYLQPHIYSQWPGWAVLHGDNSDGRDGDGGILQRWEQRELRWEQPSCATSCCRSGKACCENKGESTCIHESSLQNHLGMFSIKKWKQNDRSPFGNFTPILCTLIGLYS